jgi:hypothetical protein
METMSPYLAIMVDANTKYSVNNLFTPDRPQPPKPRKTAQDSHALARRESGQVRRNAW